MSIPTGSARLHSWLPGHPLDIYLQKGLGHFLPGHRSLYKTSSYPFNILGLFVEKCSFYELFDHFMSYLI